jgi:hypothetical protein
VYCDMYLRTYVCVGRYVYTQTPTHTNNPPHTLYVCKANICKFEVRPPRLVLVKDLMLFSLIDTLSSSGGRAQRPLVHYVCMEPSPPRITTEAESCCSRDRGVLQPSPNKSHHFSKTKSKYKDLDFSILEKTLEY